MKIAVTKSPGFTMMELMIVVGIIGLLAAICLPNVVKARTQSQTNACINNLRQIDDASQEWALEGNRAPTSVVTYDDIRPFLRNSITCPVAGNGATFDASYTLTTVSNKPLCNYVPETHRLIPDGGTL